MRRLREINENASVVRTGTKQMNDRNEVCKFSDENRYSDT